MRSINSFVKRIFDVVKFIVGTFDILLSEWVHLAALQQGTKIHLLTKIYLISAYFHSQIPTSKFNNGNFL